MIYPENIHCLALNYIGVGENTKKPLYFVKSKNALCFDGSIVNYPNNSSKLWTEVELGIVVKKDCFDISETEAEKYIEGFIVCGDITCENINNRDHHLGFSKSRKNFCPVSSEIVKLRSSELSELNLSTTINGVITQKGFLKDMFYNPYKSFSYISTITELKQGDIILTGTPAGVENNIINIGDKVVHMIEKIGKVSFEVKK
ncbi:MAG: fumarylacetoacetate hydrolase family protein [Arcobacteraceae bacterium]|jgi:2-keto-4-pentenoate hydratase/2-oxohepta-3-ene-1,7-dioic acid hydratase in catechol pathway|nr:fumarylacetoacetate hydrolase family protein [Arcobacteraceae bacterium]